MKTARRISFLSAGALAAILFAASLPADASANGNVHVTRFWHNHQPTYWPEWNSNGDQNSRVQYAWDSIVLKPSQNYGGLSPNYHPQNNLTDIFGLDDRKNAYQYGPRNSLNTFSGGGFALSYSGSLIDNVRQLGGGGNLGYGGDWNSGNTEARGWGRLDLVGFTYHHSLAPLLPKEVFRKELQIFKQAWWKAWGGNSDLSDHSKGFFPTEMAFSQSLIDVLVDEGYEWSIVASHHLSRTCPTYTDQADPEGSYNINSSPPNKADQLGPSPTTGWWYGQPNPGNAAWNVSPFAYQLHKAQYVNPSNGNVKQMYVVPSDDVLSYRFGYANEGISKIQEYISPFATDPSKPVIVMPSSDGDNAWGGGSSSWMEATPQYFNDSANAGYNKNTPQGFVDAAKANADLVHVEDGAWIFPEMCYGSPNFMKWIEPPLYNVAAGATNRYDSTQADLETPGFALKFFSYAPLMAGANWCITAEQILRDQGGSVDAWKIQAPYDWNGAWNAPNDVELAWHIYLAGLDSGFNYYGGLGNDDENKPGLATKRAVDKLSSFMSTRMDLDQTPPTVLKPQRFPYNPGGYTFGWFNYIPGGDTRYLKKMPSEFYVWTHAYDLNGIPDGNVVLKVRTDNDGANSLASTHNETYAGGGDVGGWVSVPMTKRVLKKTRTELNTAAANGEIDYFVYDPAFWPSPQVADYYFVRITDANVPGFRGKLLDYYIEATDSKGNVHKSDIEHVWVEDDGEESTINPSAAFDPAAPSDCAPITVNFNAATSALATAATVNVSYHFSTNTNDWASAAMTRTGTNTFTYTFDPVPDNAPQLEVAFTDGANWANNGGANWKVAIRDCDAPENGVLFDPAAPNGCDPVTIRYYPTGRALATATSVFIHVGRNGWQDALSPDPAMTNAGTYWEYVYVMPTNTAIIDVVFNNGAGVWDNNGGADWHVAVTNCGEAPEPLPTASISPTNAGACDPITITYNPAGRVLLGVNPVKIHIGYNGWQGVILPNPNMAASGANWTYVYDPPPGATNIDVVFNDGGSTWDNNDGADWHFDVADCPDLPTGLAITNPPAGTTVSYVVTNTDLAGIADGMTGELVWTNKLTHASGAIPAASPWSLPGVALGVGGNEIVVSGSNVVAGGTATNAVDDSTDAAYSDGWNGGNNGGTGFLGWTLNAEEGSSGHFIDTNAWRWGMWSHESNHLAEAIRTFSFTNLAVGQTFRVRMQNGWIWESGGSVGVALRDNASNTLWQLYFNGGSSNYNVSTGATDIGWTDAGIDIAFTVTGAGAYSVDVAPVGGTLRNYTGTYSGEIANFRAWSYSNGTDDGQNSNRDFFIDNLKVTSPSAGGVETYSDFVIATRQAGGSPQIVGMDLQAGGNGLGFTLGASISGATYAVWASPTLFPSQNWQRVDGTESNADGGPIDLMITNGLLPTNFFRVGYE
ncbi:MAG: hypothetical protein AB7V22_02745 [Kiritimatiellia bacterium]